MWLDGVLTSYSDWWIHHKLLSGHMGTVEWYESELWYPSWHLCWSVCDHHRPSTLWEEIESEGRCFEFCYSLVFRESYNKIDSVSASPKSRHFSCQCTQDDRPLWY
jgi:hypothetical protein